MAKERNMHGVSAPETGTENEAAAETETGVAVAAPAPKIMRVMLSAGPPEMTFCGRLWRHGQAQPVTPEEWSAMQQRGAAQLGFTMNLIEEN